MTRDEFIIQFVIAATAQNNMGFQQNYPRLTNDVNFKITVEAAHKKAARVWEILNNLEHLQ